MVQKPLFRQVFWQITALTDTGERSNHMGFEELGKKLMRLGQDTKSGVQKMGESYQINSKISDEKKKLEQLYRAIGEAVYQENKGAPLAGLEEEFEAIGKVLENIASYTEQLNKVKGVLYCTECGREAVKGERFCSGCGAKLPETEDDISAKMKQDAMDAVGEAGEIMGDVVDKAKVLVGNVADKADAFVKGVASKMNNQDTDEVVADVEVEDDQTQEAPEDAVGSDKTAEAEAEECVEESAEAEAVEEENTEQKEEIIEEMAAAADTEAVEEAAAADAEAAESPMGEAAEEAEK